MKKVVIICFAGIVVLLFLIVIIAVCSKHVMTVEEMEEVFTENEETFLSAAMTITEFPVKKGWGIEPTDPENDRIEVIQIQDLFFYGNGHLPLSKDECQRVYDVVEPLFSNAKVIGIACDTSQIQFAMSLEYGYESSIVYAFGGKEPSGSFFDTLEKKQLSKEWYAIQVRD